MALSVNDFMAESKVLSVEDFMDDGKSVAMKGLEGIEPSVKGVQEEKPTTGEQLSAGFQAAKSTGASMLAYPGALIEGLVQKIKQPASDFENNVMKSMEGFAPPPTSKLGQDYAEKLAKVLDPLNAIAPGMLHAGPISPRVALTRAGENLRAKPTPPKPMEIPMAETIKPEVATAKEGALPTLPENEAPLIPGSEKLSPQGETGKEPLPTLPIPDEALSTKFKVETSKQLEAANSIIDEHKAGKLNEAQTIQHLQQFATLEGIPPELKTRIEDLVKEVPQPSRLGGVGKKQGGAIAPDVFLDMFKDFKDTKVARDEKPIVLYHGGASLEEGMPNKGFGALGEGLYLTEQPGIASRYAKESGGHTVYPSYVNLKNPIDSKEYFKRFGERGIDSKQRTNSTEILKEEGYDGIIQKAADGKIAQAVAFDPDTQVKSAVSARPDDIRTQLEKIQQKINEARGLVKENEVAQATPSKSNTPMGQSAFGKGQRGAFDPKAFVDGFKEMSDMLTFAKTLQEKVKAKTALTKAMTEAYPDWDYAPGQQLYSKKTGKVYEITNRSFHPTRITKDGPQNYKAQYYYKTNDREHGTFDQSKMRELKSLVPLGQTKFGSSQQGSVNLGFADAIAKSIKKGAKSTGELAENILPMSTRFGNIHPTLKQRVQNLAQRATMDTGTNLKAVDPFLTEINKMDKKSTALFNDALLENDYTVVDQAVKGNPKLEKNWDQLKDTMNEVGQKLLNLGLIDNMRENYIPRIVKDYEGLINSLGGEVKDKVVNALEEAKSKAASTRSALTEVEKADVVNKILMPRSGGLGKASFAKGRVFDKVPEELKPFYASPTEAIHTYLQQANTKIATAEFFGKSLAKLPETRAIDVEGSIGNLVANLKEEGKLKATDVAKLENLLRASFGFNGSSNAIVQGMRDISNMLLLGDVQNSLAQVADAASPIITAGIKNTMEAWVRALAPADWSTDKHRTARDMGLLNHVSEEFAGEKLTTKAVRKMFNKNGMTAIDSFGKSVNLIANRLGREADAKGKSLEKTRLFQEYSPRFGADFPQLVEDLKAGKKTTLTDQLIFSELSQTQPVSKFEQVEAYNTSPNLGRSVLTLKSFLIKQVDFIYNNIARQIKEGNVRTGIKNAAVASLVFGLSNMGIQNIRDFMQNKPMTYEGKPDEIPAAVLKVFNIDKYFSDDISKNGIFAAIMGLAAPPTQVGRELTMDVKQALINADIIKGKKKDVKGESVKLIPFAGDEIYGQMKAGADRRKRLEKEQRKNAR